MLGLRAGKQRELSLCVDRQTYACLGWIKVCANPTHNRGSGHINASPGLWAPHVRPYQPLPAQSPQPLQAQTTHGYARLHVNATAFHIQAVDSATGRVFDEAVLAPRHAPAAPSDTRQQASLFARRAEALLAAA